MCLVLIFDFCCGMRNLVSWPGTEPGPPALGAWSLSHWTTREVPVAFLMMAILTNGASLVARMVKNLPTIWETWIQSLGQEDPLEKGMATNSSILAWRIPWTEGPGGPQSIGSQRAGLSWSDLAHKKAGSLLTLMDVKLFCSVQFSSVQSLSRVRLCNTMNRSTPGLPVHHQLPEFTQTHVHQVGDVIQPSHPLSSPSPPAPNPSQHQCLFQWVNSSDYEKNAHISTFTALSRPTFRFNWGGWDRARSQSFF